MNDLRALKPYGPMAFNPSSIVKTAPHFGHFTLVSLLTIPAQPKENAARTANAKTMLISFFTPLHLLSFPDAFRRNNASTNQCKPRRLMTKKGNKKLKKLVKKSLLFSAI